MFKRRSYIFNALFFSKRVTLLPLCLFLISCAGTMRTGIDNSSILPLKIVNTTLSKEIKDSVYYSTPVQPSKVFTPNDKQVVSHVSLANLTGRHYIRWDWYTPNNKIYQSTGNFLVKASAGNYVKHGDVSHIIALNSSKAADHPGNWRVEIYLDDDLAVIDDFTLQSIDVPSVKKNLDSFNFGKYYALVIGINNYKNLEKLKSANNDAREVAKILSEKYNFTVALLIDASRTDIILALDNIRKRLSKEDNLLIYYAGHGILDEDADEGFWLAADATPNNTLNWIPNHTITSTLKAMQAKHILVVADSCYSGKLVRGMQTVFFQKSGMEKPKDYYLSMARKKARTVMSSGGLEPVMDSDGQSGHSVFAATFMAILNRNNTILDGTHLFAQLRRPVMVNSDQTPQYSDIRKAGHDGGDFLFIPKDFFQKER